MDSESCSNSQFKHVVEAWEEESKKPGFSPCYEIVKLLDNPEKGWHVVATRDILMGDIILVEEPLFRLPHDKMHPTILDNPEYQKAKATLDRLTQNNFTESLTGAQFQSQCEAFAHMEEIRASFWFSRDVEPEKQAEVFMLEDSRHQAQIGQKVMVWDLQSEAGKKLNYHYGDVVKNDTRDPTRLGVEITVGKGRRVEKSIKRSNLKTLLGIMKTNGFAISDEQVGVYKTTSRINHACARARNATQGFVENKVFVMAFMKNIKAGDEILIDYIDGHEHSGLGTDRVEELQKRYNFTCDCAFHGSEPIEIPLLKDMIEAQMRRHHRDQEP